MRLIIGISGAIYGTRLLEILRDNADVETHLVMSGAAKMNIDVESNLSVKQVEALADVVLKEGRRLVHMPRESPLHVGHCRLLHEGR